VLTSSSNNFPRSKEGRSKCVTSPKSPHFTLTSHSSCLRTTKLTPHRTQQGLLGRHHTSHLPLLSPFPSISFRNGVFSIHPFYSTPHIYKYRAELPRWRRTTVPQQAVNHKEMSNYLLVMLNYPLAYTPKSNCFQPKIERAGPPKHHSKLGS